MALKSPPSLLCPSSSTYHCYHILLSQIVSLLPLTQILAMASTSLMIDVSNKGELHLNGLEVPILFPIDIDDLAIVSVIHKWLCPHNCLFLFDHPLAIFSPSI